MRIGNNNQGIWQLFSRMNGGRANTNMPFGSGASARRSGAGGRNTLEDLLSGHYKNSHGVEGMVITEGSNQKRIMPVSDEMKQHVLNRVKDAFYKYNGMLGDNEAELKKYSATINDYLKTVKKEDRSATSWTIGQLRVNLANKVSSALKAKVPGWTVGKPVSHEILDEIFAGDTIFQDSVNALYSKGGKGLDMKV